MGFVFCFYLLLLPGGGGAAAHVVAVYVCLNLHYIHDYKTSFRIFILWHWKSERPRQKRNLKAKQVLWDFIMCTLLILFLARNFFYQTKEKERENHGINPKLGRIVLRYSWQCGCSHRKECNLNIRININYISLILLVMVFVCLRVCAELCMYTRWWIK